MLSTSMLSSVYLPLKIALNALRLLQLNRILLNSLWHLVCPAFLFRPSTELLERPFTFLWPWWCVAVAFHLCVCCVCLWLCFGLCNLSESVREAGAEIFWQGTFGSTKIAQIADLQLVDQLFLGTQPSTLYRLGYWRCGVCHGFRKTNLFNVKWCVPSLGEAILLNVAWKGVAFAFIPP